MSYPRITVVTPNFNHARFLRQTIESVLAQDYPNLEYLVIDGGSTDGSVEIIQEFAPRISYWVSEPDRGQTDAIRKGFARASGEILGWLNSSDWYLPGALHAVASLFRRRSIQGVMGDSYLVDEGGRVLWRERSFALDTGSLVYEDCLWIPQPAILWSRELYERSGGLDISLRYCMDRDLLIRLASLGSFAPLSRVLACFRMHPDSKSLFQHDESNDEVAMILRRYRSGLTEAEIRRRRAAALLRRAWRYVQAGDPASGRRTLGWALARGRQVERLGGVAGRILRGLGTILLR